MVSIFFFVFLFPFKKKKKKKKKSLQTTAHVSRECRDGGGGSKKNIKKFQKISKKNSSKNGGVVTRVEDWKIDAKHLFRFFCVFFFKETLIFFFVK